MKKSIVMLLMLGLGLSAQAQMLCNLNNVIAGETLCPTQAQGFLTCTVPVPDVNNNPQARYFCLSIPPGVQQANAVFMFHGGGGTGDAVAGHWQNQQATAFLVLPVAQPINGKRKWNTVKEGLPDFDGLKAAHGHSDTEFVGKILTELEGGYACGAGPANPCILNYYAAGFSSGASMVYQLYTRNFFNGWFSGYGAVGNRIHTAKTVAYNAMAGTGNATLPIDPKPFFMMMGSDEKFHMPLDTVIDEVNNSCGGGMDLIENHVACFMNFSSSTVPSTRRVTAKWLRQTNATLPSSGGGFFDLNTDDTQVTWAHYPLDPAVAGSEPVQVWTVVNGGHFWPSTNNMSAHRMHSEDIETSDELVNFWTNHAGY